ncbi:hypothetical protein FHL15_010776 [Xylaria flabelliformis]|uniref:SnoaL-like domain-containing protein n=1 Tax=Xylaria flabelliformis TaxID=2512241 RepID=A0A553HK63_9PEZI|nr:hypothetical protein FHL15_010776 [Xylaria flabelliformis]
MSDIASTYRSWLDCINQRDWNGLVKYMHSTYMYNGKEFTPNGFAEFVQWESKRFAGYTITVDTIIVDDEAQCLACRLYSKGAPTEKMFDCEPTGQGIYFVEHHLVWFRGGKISQTLYTLDIRSVRRQLQNPKEEYRLELVNQTPIPANKELSKSGLEDAVKAFFNSINDRTMASELPKICHSELTHSGNKLTLDVYLQLAEKGMMAVPDVQLTIQNIVADSDAQRVFVRLEHQCTPVKEVEGLVPDGQSVKFAETSIYQFDDGKISRMWPIVDWEGAKRQMAAR